VTQPIIGYVLDLRPGAANVLSLVTGQPLVFGASNVRVRFANLGFAASSGASVGFSVQPGAGGTALTTSVAEAYNYASGLIDASPLFADALAAAIGLIESNGSVPVECTDAGFDALGPFLDLEYVGGVASLFTPTFVSTGSLTATLAVDVTATVGFEGRTLTALPLSGPIKVGLIYDADGNFDGYEVNARAVFPGDLVGAETTPGGTLNLTAATRVPSRPISPAPKNPLTILGLPPFLGAAPTTGILTINP